MVQVSVITTVYNGVPYVEQCAKSILGQTHGDFEWIIADDGSTDDTVTIARTVAARDPRVRVLVLGRLGRASALNAAVAEARGVFVAVQDIDDWSNSNRLKQQASFLAEHPEVGVIGGWYHIHEEIRGEEFVRMPPAGHSEIIRAMGSRIPLAHTVAMYRKEAWREVGGYPNEPFEEDFSLWISMAAAGWQFANIQEVLGAHVVHKKSFWFRNFDYRTRQRNLARLQMRAIRKLGIPSWMLIFPIGRLCYAYLPHSLKRFARRVAGSSEQDVNATLPQTTPQ